MMRRGLGVVAVGWLACLLGCGSSSGSLRDGNVGEPGGVGGEGGTGGLSGRDAALVPSKDASGDQTGGKLDAVARLDAPAGGSKDAAAGSKDAASGSKDAAPPTPAGAGCGMAATPGTLVRTVDANGKKRTYNLTVPTGYDPKHPTALAFYFHGAGGNRTQGASTNITTVGAGDVILASPDGLPRADVGGDTGWDLSANGDDVLAFDAIIADASKILCVDAHRIFAFGFSYGGWMAHAIGCHRGKTVRAIAAQSGGGPEGTCTGGAVAVWISHGQADNAEPIASGIASRDHWIKANACQTTTTPTAPSPCVAYGGCTKPVTWCAVPGLGHDGIPMATEAIWKFFQAAP